MSITKLAMMVSGVAVAGCCCQPMGEPAAVDAQDPAPKKVTERIELLKGGDLHRYWYTWCRNEKRRNVDPKGVFTAMGNTLKVTGEDMGCVTTRDAYRDYRFSLDYRYVDHPRQLNKTAARDGGILFHSTGVDGAFENGIWMCSFEYNIIQGATGDLIVVGDKNRYPGVYRATGNVEPATKGTNLGNIEGLSTQRWQADGDEITIVNWGRVRRPDCDMQWKNLKTQACSPNEKPVGLWNHCELVCRGNVAEFYFNGMKTGEYRNLNPAGGRIQLQSEGFGIEYRNIVIEPLD